MSTRSPSCAFLVLLATLVACGSEDGTDTAVSGSGGSADSSVAGQAGTSAGGASDSGQGGSAGSGGLDSGLALKCDKGFAFQPNPPQTSEALLVSFTYDSPLAKVDLKVVGPGPPGVQGGPITTTNPWTWNWTVTALQAAVYEMQFWAGEPSAQVATCQKQVLDTGPWKGDAGTDSGQGGMAGAGGSGNCCKLVGTQLANPSPCGPSSSGSPWQILDKASCNPGGGCKKIWCPFEKCDSTKHPGGCPQGTEACWIDDSFNSYEEACKSCCESYKACWDSNISTCRYPGDCGSALWKCPWEP